MLQLLNKKIQKQNSLRRAIILSLMLSPILTSNSIAAQINADSSIKAVTVYPGSAKVTRMAKITLDAGQNEVILTNLPINLNESSLRISGEGQAKVSLGSIELLRNIKLDVVQLQEKELRQKIEETQEARKEIDDALSRNRNQLDYIKNMAMGGNPKAKHSDDKSGAYANLPLEQWLQAWQTLDSATASVQEKIRLAEKSLKTSDKQLQKLKRELAMIATNQKETRSAKLHIESEITTDLTLNLSYQINGARWEPVYDADLNTDTGEIALKTLAQISQRTGEDWNNTAITLSTLRPSANSQLPQLNTWPIDFMPEPMPTAEVSGMFRNEVAMDSAIAMAPAPAPMVKMAKPKRSMQQKQARLISADFSAEYKVPGNISLSSGSNKRRFALSAQNLKSKVHLASAPRLDPRAMILATSNYLDESPLLAGSMSLYRNGSFVGNTFLSQKLSGEEIKLSFGEDDKVKITFLPDPDKKRKDGLLFGKKKVVERHYKVNISSNHAKPYSISLHDVFPTASHEDIKVKMLGDAPDKTDVEDKKGVSSWERNLAPKKSLSVKYGYSVSYPEDQIVPGL